MIYFVSNATILNRGALETRRVPKAFLKYNTWLIPRTQPFSPAALRLLMERQLLRYGIALSPFPLALIIWPHLALPIAQAPLLMFLLVWLVETRVLSVPRAARRTLIDEDAALEILDRLTTRGTAILGRLAAERGLAGGQVHLVIEQSELMRIAPLTLVSIQADSDGAPQLLDLTETEREAIAATLFDADLPEAGLRRANLFQDVFLRDIAFDASTVSAHARLAALAGR